MKNEITVRKFEDSTYVDHAIENMSDARELAYAMCREMMLPVYFGTGYPVPRPHAVCLDYGTEVVIRIYPYATAESDGHETVHSFKVAQTKSWPTEKQLQVEADALEAARGQAKGGAS